MVQQSTKRTKRQMTVREQFFAISRVARLSFMTAPGAVTFKILGALLNALLPLVTAYFAALTTTALVSVYSHTGTGSRALFYIVITAALGLVSTIWGTVDQYIQASMRYRIESKVSDQMYEHFLNLEFWRYDDKETIDLYDKAQKFAQFFAWIFDRLATIISQLITMVASITALLFINQWLALILLLAIIPSVFIQFKLSRSQIAHWNSNIDSRRTQSMIEWDILQPITAVDLRLYGIVRYLLDLRMKLRDKDEKARIDFEWQFMGKRLVAVVLQTIAELSSLVWIALEIIAHRQPVGQFIYVQQVVGRAISGATAFISELGTIDEDVANLFDYEKFMQLSVPQHGQKTVKEVPHVITLDHISFSYPGTERRIIHDISFTITEHQHIALVGENGAGKTTLIKLLSGLYKPDEGDILLDDEPLSSFDIASWHRKIAVLSQTFNQYAFTNIHDNVLFGDVEKHDEAQLHRSLHDAEAADFVTKLPHGLKTLLNNWNEDEEGNKGTSLSGGQWQRLALARNFYRDSPIIILDEPTSAIDALAESRIFDRLFKRGDKTIITISHRLTTIRNANIIYMMKDGRITEQGTCDELLAKKGDFYTMFKSQL